MAVVVERASESNESSRCQESSEKRNSDDDEDETAASELAQGQETRSRVDGQVELLLQPSAVLVSSRLSLGLLPPFATALQHCHLGHYSVRVRPHWHAP